MDSCIAASGITKSFKEVVAVKNATMRCGRGINIIIGPNGAGKSTLLRCLGGLYRPDSGTVRAFGEDPYSKDSVRSNISILSDNYALYDRLSVMSNLIYFGRLYDLKNEEIKKRAQALLKSLDAYQYINRKASELSRGTKQKVAICRALLNEPNAVILDEPTAFLDAVSSERVHRMMEELAQDGKIIVYATQRLNEATRFEAKLFVMKEGRISSGVSTAQLYKKELNNSVVNIRLANRISPGVAKKVPNFQKLQGSVIKISIHDYRDINKALGYIIKNGGNVVSVDYTEPLIEGMLGD